MADHVPWPPASAADAYYYGALVMGVILFISTAVALIMWAPWA